MLKKNQLLRLQIEDLNNLGFGVGRADGQVVFVKGAVDGDEVTAKVILVNKSYAIAKVEELHEPSPHRTKTGCPAKGCGGCAYREVSYAHELELKHSYVQHAFRKAGLFDVTVAPVVSDGRLDGYRNKAQFAVAPDKNGECMAGFFAPKSHRLVEAVDCLLQDEHFAPVVREVLAFCREFQIPPYEEASHTGLLRHIYLRASGDGKMLLTLVINGTSWPQAEAFEARIKTACPGVIGVLLNINCEKTNVICSEDYRLLFGKPYLKDVLCDVELSLSAASFYQVNRPMAELLYRHAAKLAHFTGQESLLDLYCGVGSIGLSMAHMVRQLVGVEIVPSAVERATENARAAGIKNAKFICADAGGADKLLDTIRREMGQGYVPSAVVLDPPRKGCTKELLQMLSDTLQVPKIIYISCDPVTLARDAAELCQTGYTMSEVTPFDLFPRTGHVETIVCFNKQ